MHFLSLLFFSPRRQSCPEERELGQRSPHPTGEEVGGCGCVSFGAESSCGSGGPRPSSTSRGEGRHQAESRFILSVPREKERCEAV